MSADKSGGRPFRVLVTCDYFEPGFRGGGPARSVAQILDTASSQVDVRLIARDRDLGTSRPYPGLSGRWVDRGRARVFYLDVHRAIQWFRLWRVLRRSSFDLLYVNSLWSPLLTVVPVVAVRLGLIRVRAIVVAPRGSLSAAALSIKERKKRAFMCFWAPLLRDLEVMWQATADRESADIRAVFPWADVKFSRDSSALPAEPLEPTAPDAVAHLVYIGRIAAIKNLELTHNALLTVSLPVVLDIYGPMEDQRYWAKCQKLAKLLPHFVRIRYLGAVSHTEVRATFARYDAFIFPTLSENYGHTIAEALSASCPVVCSAETPWTSILENGGGTVLKALTPGCLGAEISRIAAMTPAERLRLRRSSGEAYKLWRRDMHGTNILHVVLGITDETKEIDD